MIAIGGGGGAGRVIDKPVIHRDLKPENIMVKDDQVKLIDFGSCRGIYSKLPYTEYIATRWYRPPECLLSDGFYNHKVRLSSPVTPS